MICVYILISLIIGVTVGAIIMHYRTRYLLNNQKTLYNELQNNKIKLNEYQRELSKHFLCTIELLNKMIIDYRNLYHNVKKSANFFLPNAHIQDIMCMFNTKEANVKNEQLPIEAPLDYSNNNTENILKNNDNK